MKKTIRKIGEEKDEDDHWFFCLFLLVVWLGIPFLIYFYSMGCLKKSEN